MAATVEGLFKIIDGASGPMRKMELQAKKTDDAIDKLGSRLDNVGSDKQLKQMEDVDRQIKTIDRDSRTFAGDSGGGGRLRKTLQGAGDDSDRLSTKLGRVGISLASIGKIFQAMKLPLIISGVVALVQGVSALAGGAAALIPKLTDLVGVAGALPATFLGIGIAVGAAKLAFSGIDRALKGTKGAMAALTPQGREFVRVLKELKPVTNELKSSAQAGLFPGLTAALSQLQRGVPTAKNLLRQGGSTLGGIAERAAGAFTTKGFLSDLQSVGKQGLTVLNRLGSALINVVEAFRHIAVAAEPFTEWLSKTILGWSQMLEQSALTGRRTGELRSYFDRTRASLETFGSILSNLWGTLRGIGKAARPLGDELWESADKATERWDNFANSLSGQNQLRDYFDSLKANLDSIFKFVGELSKAFIRLGTGGGLAHTMDMLTKALEPLEDLFQTIGEKYGPALAKTLEQLIRLFDTLGGGSSALLSVLELMNMLLEAVNGLLEAIPGLSNLIVGVLGAVALNSLGSRLRMIAADWGLIATEAGRATAAQRSAGTVPVGSGPIGAGRGGVVAGIAGGVAGRFGLPKVFGGRGLTPGYSTTFQQARAAGYSTSASAAAQGGALAIGAGRGLMAGIGAAGRFLAPASAILGGIGALTYNGNLPERAAAGLSQASFGIIPMPEPPSERQQKVLEFTQKRVSGILGEVPETRSGAIATKRRLGKVAKEFGKQGGDLGPAQEYIEKVMDRLDGVIHERSAAAGAAAVEDFSKAFEIRTKNEGVRKAGQKMLGPIMEEMGKIGPQGAKVLARAELSWYREAAKQNPKLKGLYESAVAAIEAEFALMGHNVEIINGHIYSGTAKEWKGIADAMSSQAERAQEEVSTSFTKLQQQALGSLMAMGYNHTQATNIVKGMEQGGSAGREARSDATKGPSGNGARPSQNERAFNKAHGYAYGGYRIGGFGNQDRYALGGGGVGAAGELVVNKHTERSANEMLGAFGTSLGHMVAGEGRPHSELTYARGGRRPAFGGGIESVGRYAAGMGLSVSGGPGFGGIPSSGHVSDSLHYSGLAYDVSGAPNLMYSFRRAAEQRYLGHGLNELFYDPYPYFIDEGTKHPGSIGGHSDHVHIGFYPGGPTGASAVRGLMMGASGGFKRVKAPSSKLGGVPGALAQAGMSAMAAGLNHRIAQAASLKGVGSEVMLGAGGKIGGSRAAVERAIAQVLFAHGANKIAAAGIIGNAWRESGMDPGAEGTGGGGLWGFTSGAISLANLKAAGGSKWENPIFQTLFMLSHGGQGLIPALNKSASPEAAAALFMNEWERPGIPALSDREAGARVAFRQGFGKGGRLPSFAGWFGTGGTVEAHRPTLLGIGDGGAEVASVRPKGRGTAGGGGLRIGSVTVHNHRPGDIRKQIVREVNQAFNDLASDLDLEPDTGDDEVLD
jgi:hypothetical protein